MLIMSMDLLWRTCSNTDDGEAWHYLAKEKLLWLLAISVATMHFHLAFEET